MSGKLSHRRGDSQLQQSRDKQSTPMKGLVVSAGKMVRERAAALNPAAEFDASLSVFYWVLIAGQQWGREAEGA